MTNFSMTKKGFLNPSVAYDARAADFNKRGRDKTARLRTAIEAHALLQRSYVINEPTARETNVSYYLAIEN